MIVEVRERKLSKEEEELVLQNRPVCPLCGAQLIEWSLDGEGECPVHGHVIWDIFSILEEGDL